MRKPLIALLLTLILFVGCGESILKNDEWEKDVKVGDELYCKSDINDPFEEPAIVKIVEEKEGYFNISFYESKIKVSCKKTRLYERGCYPKPKNVERSK